MRGRGGTVIEEKKKVTVSREVEDISPSGNHNPNTFLAGHDEGAA